MKVVRIEISGGDMTIDLRESADAASGPVNCGEAQAVSACRVAYKLLVAADLPTNGGSFAPLTVRVRKGSIVHIPPGVIHGAKGRMRVLVIGVPDIADDDLFFPEDG